MDPAKSHADKFSAVIQRGHGIVGAMASRWQHSRPWKRARTSASEAPQDNKDCAIVTWIWGTKLEILVDVLVLGGSLEFHGSKIQRVICVTDDTNATPMGLLVRAFWTAAPVTHMELPEHLTGTEQKRLQGVYSKLQTWNIFAKDPWKRTRVLLMDGDMMCNQNIDEIFQTRPPAAVFRGEADTTLVNQRPAPTYFFKGKEDTFTKDGVPMKGGINGGLVLLQPDVKEFHDMKEALKTFHTSTGMAEQDFLSWWKGKSGSWWAMHKKFNFQTHQLYYNAGSEAPVGQETSSSYWWLINHPNDVKIYHYSAKEKPSHLLVAMHTEDIAWNRKEKEVDEWLDWYESQKNRRMEAHRKREPEHQSIIRAAHKEALMKWLDMWSQTYTRLCTNVLNACWKAAGATYLDPTSQVPVWFCTHCDEIFEDLGTNDEVQTQVRDHIFFNCPEMRKYVKQSLEDTFDLRTLFRVPTGSNVKKKLAYVASILTYFEGGVTEHWDNEKPLYLKTWMPVTICDGALYDQLPQLPTLDPAFGRADEVPPDEQDDHSSESRRAANPRAILRRYLRATGSIRKRVAQDFRQWPNKEQKQWVETLRSAADSVEWMMQNDTPMEAKTDMEHSAPPQGCRPDSMRPPPPRPSSSASSADPFMLSRPKARTMATGAASKAKARPSSSPIEVLDD